MGCHVETFFVEQSHIDKGQFNAPHDLSVYLERKPITEPGWYWYTVETSSIMPDLVLDGHQGPYKKKRGAYADANNADWEEEA